MSLRPPARRAALRRLRSDRTTCFQGPCWVRAGRTVLVGAGTAGGAYEYRNKQDLDQLNREYKGGKVSKQEYGAREKEIEKGSVVH